MTMDWVKENAWKLLKKAPEKGKEMVKDGVKDGGINLVLENTVGYLCTKAAKGEEAQISCKAASRLYDVGKSGYDTVKSCSAAGAAGAATVASDGLGLPLLLMTGGACVYNGAKFYDNTKAMYDQWKTGKEVKTVQEKVKDKLGGAWVKEQKDALVKKAYDAMMENATRMPNIAYPIP